MATLAWFMAIAAIVIQLLNLKYLVTSAFTAKHESQVHIVPCIFWYMAVSIRREPFFMSTIAGEMLAVAAIHIFLSILLPFLLVKPPSQ